MSHILLPKTYVTPIKNKLIFLAGPIRSAPRWQDEAIEILLAHDHDLIIASPRRDVQGHIKPYLLQGDTTYFHRQRAWERHYLDIAGKEGRDAILFWLPGEAHHTCNKVYGAMTRIELGQWMTYYKHDPTVRFCVGSDSTFPELDTIKYDLSLDAPKKTIFKSLEATCHEALRLAFSRKKTIP